MLSLEKLTSSNRILGTASKVSEKEADEYFNSRSYGSRIGAWSSNQSSVLHDRQDLIRSIEKFKKNFQIKKNSKTKTLVWLEIETF